MNVNLVIIVIIVIIVLSFIVGLVLKRNYKKGLVLLNTTIIPSIGKDRTTIPQNNSTPVMVETKKIESEKGSVVVSPQIGAIQNSPVVVPNSVPQVVPINETPTVSAVAPVERPAFVPEDIPVTPVEDAVASVEESFTPESIPVIASELISNENDVENNTEIETTISNPLIPLDIPMVSVDDTMPRIEFVDNSSTNEPILIPMDIEKGKTGIMFDSPDEILDLLPEDGDNTDLK